MKKKQGDVFLIKTEVNQIKWSHLLLFFRNVPEWKQRIAGKSLPMEKFAVRKAQRFLEQDNHLLLPALELIYVWNGFRILGKQYHLVEPIYVMIEETGRKLEECKGNAEAV